MGFFQNIINFFNPSRNSKPNDPAIKYTKDVKYGIGYINHDKVLSKDLKLDIIEPKINSSSSRKCIVMVHGGSFTKGSKTETPLIDLATKLAVNKGYVCFLVDYRLENDNPPAPSIYNVHPLGPSVHAAAVDVKTALRFVKANSSLYNVDISSLVILGESAGAIASFTAAMSDQEDFYKDLDTYDVPTVNNPGETPRPKVIIDLWGSATLVLNEFNEKTQPIMVVHGIKDKTIGAAYWDALMIKNRTNKFNIPCSFYTDKTAGHGCWNIDFYGKNISSLVIDFLTKYN